MSELDISHKELHDKLEHMEDIFTARYVALVKWFVGSVLVVVSVTFASAIERAMAQAEFGSIQTMVVKTIEQQSVRLNAMDARINSESREAERDLNAHRKEVHGP